MARRRGRRGRRRKTAAEQAEILNSPVNPENDPIIRALINDMVTATNAEAGEIALAMQRVIRGENLDDTNPEMAAKYREYLHDIDAESAKYEAGREKFITDAYDEAVELTDIQKDKLNEKTNKKMAYYRQQARMNSSQKKKWMTDQLENGPKVKVHVEPRIVMGSMGGQPASEIQGRMIRISGVSVYLEPGENMTHPIIADRYKQIKRSERETMLRKQVLQGHGIQDAGDWRIGKPDGWQQTARRMAEIDAEFESKGEDWNHPSLHR